MLKLSESEQSLDDILKVRDLEEIIDSRYRVLDVGGTRRIGSFADDFIILPVGKSSMGYTWDHAECVNSYIAQ